MELIKSAQAGTLESSDLLVLIEPASKGSGLKIELESSVILQFGKSIKENIQMVLDKYGVEDAHLVIKDKGALTPTIIARLNTAVKRALGISEGTMLN